MNEKTHSLCTGPNRRIPEITVGRVQREWVFFVDKSLFLSAFPCDAAEDEAYHQTDEYHDGQEDAENND